MERNSREYVAPHPESAKIVPASEAVTERAKGKQQAVSGVRVRGEVSGGSVHEMQERMEKVVINGTGEKANGVKQEH